MDEFDTLMNLVVGDVATEARRSYSLSVGDEVDGFKITGHIGFGATSEVYSAVNPDFGTECALKILVERRNRPPRHQDRQYPVGSRAPRARPGGFWNRGEDGNQEFVRNARVGCARAI